MVNVSDIRARDWSPKVGYYGEVVTDLDDIRQSLMICWLTPYGSVPIRRTFGSMIHRYLDRPYPEAKAGIPLAVIEAARWETRAVIDKVTTEPSGIAGMVFTAYWHPVTAPEQVQQTTVTAQDLTSAATSAAALRATVENILNTTLNLSDLMRKSEYASAQKGVVKAAEQLSATAPDGKHYTAELGEQGRIIAEDN